MYCNSHLIRALALAGLTAIAFSAAAQTNAPTTIPGGSTQGSVLQGGRALSGATAPGGSMSGTLHPASRR